MLGPVLLAASRSDRMRRIVAAAPVTRPVVDRFVAGEELPDALGAVRELSAAGLETTLDHLGEDVTDRATAAASRDAYLRLLEALDGAGLAGRAEVSVKLSAFGQALPDGGHDVALENVRRVAEAATAAGTTVTLDMEDHTTVDSTLAILAELRKEHPGTGAVLQAYLYRTEDDCRALAVPGSRVRLVKGAYREPASVAHTGRREVDRAYVRCLRILMAGTGTIVNVGSTSLIDGVIGIQARTDVTVINPGTIESHNGTSGTAIQFAAGSNLLVADPSAVFVGSLSAAGTTTLELASASSAR